jgi:toxin ParE1/3/4
VSFDVSIEARADLVATAEWTIEKFGEEQAEKYIRLLNDSFAALPRKSSRLVDVNGQKFWKQRVGSHVVYFTRESDYVFIVRVLHESMLPENHLH